MPENKFRQKFQASTNPLIGIFITLRNAGVVEMAGLAGLDFVIIDMEHTNIDEIDLEDTARAGKAAGLCVMVRVRDKQPEAIGRVMETGIDGLLIPQVDSAQEALDACRAAYYPPRGSRGMSSLSRAAGFGFGMSQADPFCAVQIESAASIKNLESILAVPLIDMVFIGPGDLRNSLLPSDGSTAGVDDALQSSIRKVVEAVRGRERPLLGVPATHPAMKWDLAACVSAGARFATLGADASVLAGGLRSMVGAFRQ